ncbi:MAG: hypothetical protein Q7T51_01020 [Candidatus Moranbacteria bacterium]|nr:hypothetical protein [Candidatus Moranbacteria bacterium]
MKKDIVVASLLFTIGLCGLFSAAVLGNKLLAVASISVLAAGVMKLAMHDLASRCSYQRMDFGMVLAGVLVLVECQLLRLVPAGAVMVRLPYSPIMNAILLGIVFSAYSILNIWLARIVAEKIESRYLSK